MLIIYRKTTGEVVENQGKMAHFPNGVPDPSPIIQNVITRFGGNENDYDIFRLHDFEDSELVNRTFTHEVSIQNGKIVFGKEKTIDLETAKERRITELSKDCEQVIEAGFISKNGRHYRTNRDDQLNFLGKYNQLMSNESITDVFWKTEDQGYLPHTREEWLSIYFEGITHKEQALFKLDGLRKLVNAATTVAEIEVVVW